MDVYGYLHGGDTHLIAAGLQGLACWQVACKYADLYGTPVTVVGDDAVEIDVAPGTTALEAESAYYEAVAAARDAEGDK